MSRAPQNQPHNTKVDTIPGTQPQLFGAVCFTCGWESESLWSDPEAAEEEVTRHQSQSSPRHGNTT